MARANTSTSWSTPHTSSGRPSPASREKPVPTASRNTRSLTASRVCGLSPKAYGAGGVACGVSVGARRGPNPPMFSHKLAEPGPPLKANVTGRVASDSAR